MANLDSSLRIKYSGEINRLKQAYNQQLLERDTRTRVAEAKAEKYQLRSDTRGSWLIGLIIACCVLLILCIILWKFRRQAKAANSVINSGEDLASSVKKLLK